MQAIVEALDSINYSLTHPTGWEMASVIISAVSLILTVAVLFYNHRSISLAQKSIKQAIDLQLYEKRLELFKRLSEQNAFLKVPVEIKIVYSDEIYNLYSAISLLCKKRVDLLADYNQRFCLYETIVGQYYNVCDDKMQDIKDYITQKVRELQESKNLDCEHRANSLIEYQKELEEYTNAISEKYSMLERLMERQLKISIGI